MCLVNVSYYYDCCYYISIIVIIGQRNLFLFDFIKLGRIVEESFLKEFRWVKIVRGIEKVGILDLQGLK